MTIKFDNLSDKEFLQRYLELSNTLLPSEQRLVPSEIELIIEFCLLPEDKFNYQRFGSLAKNRVIKVFEEKGKVLTKLNINNKLYALLDKGFLRRDEDKVIYLPKHLLNVLNSFRQSRSVTFSIVLNGSK